MKKIILVTCGTFLMLSAVTATSLSVKSEFSSVENIFLTETEALAGCEIKDPKGTVILDCKGSEKLCKEENPNGPGDITCDGVKQDL